MNILKYSLAEAKFIRELLMEGGFVDLERDSDGERLRTDASQEEYLINRLSEIFASQGLDGPEEVNEYGRYLDNLIGKIICIRRDQGGVPG